MALGGEAFVPSSGLMEWIFGDTLWILDPRCEWVRVRVMKKYYVERSNGS